MLVDITELTFDFLCSAMDNMRLARAIEERQRYNALQMKKSSKEASTPGSSTDSVGNSFQEKLKERRKL